MLWCFFDRKWYKNAMHSGPDVNLEWTSGIRTSVDLIPRPLEGVGGGPWISWSSLEFYGVMKRHLRWLQGFPRGEESDSMLRDYWMIECKNAEFYEMFDTPPPPICFRITSTAMTLDKLWLRFCKHIFSLWSSCNISCVELTWAKVWETLWYL